MARDTAIRYWTAIFIACLTTPAWAREPTQEPARIRTFIGKHCLDCHEGGEAKSGLDLSELGLDAADTQILATWVKVHDRVRDGEMPPGKHARPPHRETRAFLTALAAPLVAADRAREAAQGRATWRRLNRHEYENTVRELFQAPWLQLKNMLPEDGEAHRFNKVGDALDVSHVQMAQYLAAAESAMREVLAAQTVRPVSRTVRYRARDMKSFAFGMKFSEFHIRPERRTFPVLGFAGQPDVRAGKAPLTTDDGGHDDEGMGVVQGAYQPLQPRFDGFIAPQAGRYRVRLCAHSVWVGPGKAPSWWIPDLDVVSRGRRPEPIALYSEMMPHRLHQLRRLGAFDVGPDPTVAELDVLLLRGETIRPDPARLFRSRPSDYHNPLATQEGQPGVVYRWLEVTGPLVAEWPPLGRRLLFGELAVEPKTAGPPGSIVVASTDPKTDAGRLMSAFVKRAYPRPAAQADIERFVKVVHDALDKEVAFAEAMMAGYSAVLCSPGFIYLREERGRLDAVALASRLSYFLWNSPPDEALRAAAARGELGRPQGLRAQAERMLAEPKARRFVDAFLDYWVDLRRMNATAPDAALYPDYYLDDLLLDSATEETQLFFAELLRRDLPARNLVNSDFVMVNERLAAHYRLPPVAGVKLRAVSLPAGSARGGLITQASVLKVTANGTTTSPVLRGAWIMERILGKPVPPPPPNIPAVEPDIRGASTIREQLDKHRNDKACAACHAKIDPAGFALESFDVFGGWRNRYRALGDGGPPVSGYGKNGLPFQFHEAQSVDAAGELPGGSAFRNVQELKELLLRDERQIARNLVAQLVVFSTGAPVRFGDRAEVEAMLDRAAARRGGVRTLILGIVASDLFRRK